MKSYDGAALEIAKKVRPPKDKDGGIEKDDDDSEDSDSEVAPELIAAAADVRSAKTDEEYAAALKDFIRICGHGYEE